MKRYIVLLIAIGLFNLNGVISQTADKYLVKAGMLSELKQFNEASSALSLSNASENKNYTRIMADVQYGLNNFQKAIELYNKVEEKTPGSCQLELAQCYAMLNNKEEASVHLKSYFKQKNKLPLSKITNDKAFSGYKNDPDWGKILQNVEYSELEIKINQVNSASETGYNDYFNNTLNDALKKYPNNPELLYQQSRFYEDKKMFDAAQKAISQAIDLKLNDAYLYQKSVLLQKNRSSKDALASINDAITRNPFNLKYYLLRIEINKALNNSDKVSEDVNFIDFCLPEDPAVQLVKIQMDADKGNYLTAINGLNDLIEKDQSKASYYLLRGKIGLKAQQLQNADEDFGMALDLNPSDADANLGKGIAKYKLEDSAAACFYWQKASNEGSREALDYLNKYCGK